MAGTAVPAPLAIATGDPQEFTERMTPVAPGMRASGLRRGRFFVGFSGIPLAHVSLLRVRCRNVRVRDDASRGYVGVTMALTDAFAVQQCGIEHYAPGSAHILRPDDAFDCQVRDGVVLAANIDATYVSRVASQLAGELEPVATHFAASADLAGRYGAVFWRAAMELWRAAIGHGEAPLSRTALCEREAAFVTGLLLVSDAVGARRARRDGAGTHAGALRPAEEWVSAHLRDPLTRAELCAVSGLDVRTLSRAFQRRHDMSPMEYVRTRRLDAVSRTLLAHGPDETSVTEVAMDYGFHHLSRFAADYRRRFGELPSETLRR